MGPYARVSAPGNFAVRVIPKSLGTLDDVTIQSQES